jgi:hypothetical protein
MFAKQALYHLGHSPSPYGCKIGLALLLRDGLGSGSFYLHLLCSWIYKYAPPYLAEISLLIQQNDLKTRELLSWKL